MIEFTRLAGRYRTVQKLFDADITPDGKELCIRGYVNTNELQDILSKMKELQGENNG